MFVPSVGRSCDVDDTNRCSMQERRWLAGCEDYPRYGEDPVCGKSVPGVNIAGRASAAFAIPGRPARLRIWAVSICRAIMARDLEFASQVTAAAASSSVASNEVRRSWVSDLTKPNAAATVRPNTVVHGAGRC